MAKKMLIDATHPEETRVVVVDGNKVDDFDFESITKRQLAGNIYLAKVTRVEPSLQAAFIDYGGNRHGFLAFSEIHPDYYQIPVADREALIAEEEEEAARERRDEEEAEGKDNGRPGRKRGSGGRGRGRRRKGDAADNAGAEDKAAAKEKAEDADGTGKDAGEAPAQEASAAEAAPGEDGPPDLDAGPEKAPPAEPRDVIPPQEDGTPSGAEAAPDAEPQDGAPGTGEDDTTGDEGGTPPRGMAESAGSDDADTVAEAVSEAGDDGGKPRRASPDEDSDADADEDDGTSDAAAASDADEPVEEVGAEDVREEAAKARARRPRRRSYKIQDVIKVRQILLVQVVKEERGNKGAAMTTYLSLAGRYCVLMPNTARGGGISRKITNAPDRKRLKEIAGELELSKGMGLIVRTAGAERTRAEIKRDYEYLLRQWEQVRELTLKSIAPALIYEEGSLIKRSIRDLYSREIDTILVDGDAAYKEAKDYMKMLMPSHAKNVRAYQEAIPLFTRYQVESYLNGMFSPTVQLKSGGYIVIGVTEALVAIDVNSGRSTREHSIEETALKTNLEAAEEVARQLRLRDLAGLIVIDFIDMDEGRNNRAVEKRFKERLKNDRARLQVGRISAFGLLEMSRQRLRPGMLEATTQPCPHCQGTGIVRSAESLSLSILREIEEEGVRGRSAEITAMVPVEIANYVLNHKRAHVAQIESRYGMTVNVVGDPGTRSPDFAIDRAKTSSRPAPQRTAPVNALSSLEAEDAEVVEASDAAPASSGGRDAASARGGDDGDENGERKRRRGKRGGRRRRRGGDDDRGGDRNTSRGDESAREEPSSEDAAQDAGEAAPETKSADGSDDERGRRRRRRSDNPRPKQTPGAMEVVDLAPEGPTGADSLVSDHPADPVTAREPEPAEEATAAPQAPADPEPEEPEAPEAPEESAAEPAPEPEAEPAPEEPAKPKRRGWWSFR